MQQEHCEKQVWEAPRLILLGRGNVEECGLAIICKTVADPGNECHSFDTPNDLLVSS